MIMPFATYLYKDEESCIGELLDSLSWDKDLAHDVRVSAIDLVNKARDRKGGKSQLESFLQEFSLDTEEGLAMMCLAEALLRIPDSKTANLLIRDKIKAAEWLHKHGEKPKDLLTRAVGLGLALTHKTLDSAFARLGEPIIREAMVQAMQIMGRQFVLGANIEGAIKNANSYEKQGYRLSYDMLGEGARDAKTAQGYFESYAHAIRTVAERTKEGTGVSVKLSALHPRYTYTQKDNCAPVLVEKLTELAVMAAHHNIPMTIDAEEVARLDLSIEIFKRVFASKKLKNYEGLGLAVQAYQKRGLAVLDYLAGLSLAHKKKIPLRLVKGAYWDSEIKVAQMNAAPDYPVYTRKSNTDLSYLACTQKILGHKDAFYPMFATHNAHTIAAILKMANKTANNFEFQRLHGMGEGVYASIVQDYKVSIYAPVGPHKDLLPYLVRRLLENGANSSFVNKMLDSSVPPESLITDPVEEARGISPKHNNLIPLPRDIFGSQRQNSKGLDLNAPSESQKTIDFIANYQISASSESLINGRSVPKIEEGDAEIEKAFKSASEGFKSWNKTDVQDRAQALLKFAQTLEDSRDEFMAILAYEGGKTLPDARDEVREAVDFCRYYAAQGLEVYNSQGHKMQGYTGESNHLLHEGRGVFVCISPWNFPLAIFTGQIAAALVAGNAVMAKPASQTRKIARRTVELMHQSGIPKDVLHLFNVGGTIGNEIVSHPQVAGVAFTGSTATAKHIQKTLADHNEAIIPLIAETGGQNAMIVDSSALPEQVLDDVLLSAFGSAGQRCSALRVLYVQDEIADNLMDLIKNAMAELNITEPWRLSADIGHIIDQNAKSVLEAHEEHLEKNYKFIAKAKINEDVRDKSLYFAPIAYEIPSLSVLKEEIFGPVLHIIRYKGEDLENIIEEINNSEYGLTCGIHSRIQTTQDRVAKGVRAGNIYVNRSMIGAVVGVQPFGGMGLSGTGPKAGGPDYIKAFGVEKNISINTTAMGGNTSLIMLRDD
ncbi:MAG: bifunctional proline dehydrogenase/L-glutamate gamma-semialdehyde dehydrogenase PutA [Alphaproteobacteria bacterium]|nr:bifunctional proline dehydrogenase/L-glutamate gamma-semialdehyde dehydrogenase PutA [Alphaproteobacteria bacterium]